MAIAKVAEITRVHEAIMEKYGIPKNILKQRLVIGQSGTSHKSKVSNSGGVGKAGLRSKRWWRCIGPKVRL